MSATDAWDLKTLAATHRKMAEAIAKGLVVACHDVSDGGVAVAAAEMCIASGLGLIVGEGQFVGDAAFEERPGRYLVELADVAHGDELRKILAGAADVTDLGLVQHLKKLTVTTEKERVIEIGIEEMTQAWRGTLDW